MTRPTPAQGPDVLDLRDTADGLAMSIPARRHRFALFFLPVWLLGWALGETLAVRQLGLRLADGDAPETFLLVWLTGWTLGGAVALYSWLWMLAGREQVLLGLTTLTIRRALWSWGRSRVYPLVAVRDLRVGAVLPSTLAGGRFPATRLALGSTLEFTCDGRVIRFGAALTPANAARVYEAFLRRRPSLRSGT